MVAIYSSLGYWGTNTLPTGFRIWKWLKTLISCVQIFIYCNAIIDADCTINGFKIQVDRQLAQWLKTKEKIYKVDW